MSALMLANAASAQATAPVADPQSPSARSNPAQLPPTQADQTTLNEVVVTGTLIRGIAPAGSNVIGVSEQQVQATGAVTTNQLLQNLPQNAAGFLGLTQPGGGNASANAVVPINRPNLRNLPGGNTSSGALTLVLIDGHRVVGAGIGQVAVDPDVIPPGALERVETITDGGSAIYGSDAIGGVINFITRRRFEGVRAAARYGFAENYNVYSGDLTIGRNFGDANAFLSYNYSEHDPLFGSDRDFVRQIDWSTNIPTGRQCDAPNVTTRSGVRSFAYPNLALGTFNACDLTDHTTLYASDKQHHLLAGFNMPVTDGVEFDLKAFYTRRYNEANSGPFRSTVTLAPTNPNYIAIPGEAGQSQAVSFSYAPALGNRSAKNRTLLQTWNVTPTATVELPRDWQLRGLVNYGESFSKFANDVLFTSRVNAAATAGTLNPFNVAATPVSLLNTLYATNVGRAWHRFSNARAIVDGGLFDLPGGELRLAFGAEYMRSRYEQQLTNTANFTLNPKGSYTQSVKSVFGEVQAPIVGEANRFPGVEALTLSVSARYDSYNDFGDTTNPKVGLTYKPVEWISIFGNWGKSFNAPTPVDQLGTASAQSLVLQGQPSNYPNTATPNPPLQPGQTTYSFVLLRGAVADLQPQTSKNWSVGFRIEPPFMDGFTANLSYYHIDFRNQISSPLQGTDTQVFFRQFPELVTVDPTPAQLQALAAQVNGGLANLASIPAGGRVVAMYDIRARNIGQVKLSGLDFGLNYVRDMGFGTMDFSLNGNYQLQVDRQVSPSAPVINALETGASRLRLAATVGANWGALRAQATLQHQQGYNLTPAPTLLLTQTRVEDFNVVNLFFRYDFEGEGLRRDLTATLNVDNVFDTDPPILRDRNNSGYANGLTVGRLISIGLDKKF